jgi:glutathione S-transferase
MFPEMEVDEICPRLADWRDRMEARPGVKAALKMPDNTKPELRTFTGHAK